MKLKLILQLILLASIFTIIVIFYYSFFVLKDNKIKPIVKNDLQIEEGLDNKILNELVNIEYNSSDNEGNTFYINAERATIELDDKKNNIVNLEGVVSIINLKDKGIINIYSNNATYNKLDHNTLFFNEVKVEYLSNIILSQNLDVIFTENISKIYNNVVYKNNNLNLNTDSILINMITGDIKLEMLNKSEKIRLVANHEFVN